MAMFFLLTIALSEHVPFELAWVILTASCMLRSEDNALPRGILVLFAGLAAAMLVTRRMD